MITINKSLEKKLKQDPWDFQTIREYIKDHKHIPELSTNLDWLPLEEVLIELGKVADKIRERILEYVDDEAFANEIVGLLVEEKNKPRTKCLSCGYDGDEIQGDYPDLYRGYGCPKCHSPLIVIVEPSKGER